MYHKVLDKLFLSSTTNPVEHSQPVELDAETAVGIDVVCFTIVGLTNITISIEESNDLENWTPTSGGTVTVTSAPSVQLGSMSSTMKVLRGFIRAKVATSGTGTALLSVKLQTTQEA